MLPLKKFKIGKITKNNNKYLLYIKTHNLEINVHDLRIYNLQPFTIEINEQMDICNNTDTVKVSIDNFAKRTIQIRFISIEELTNYFNIQFEIKNFIINNKSKVKPTDSNLDDYLQEIEVALLLDDILAMNRAKVLNMAFDTKDTSTFNKIMDSGENE